MKKKFLSVALAAVIVVAGAAPASAGSISWTSSNGSVGGTSYGEHWYSAYSQYGAYTTHYQWANLGVQGKYNAYGVWYYTPTVVHDHVATSYSGHYIDLHQHWW